MKSPTFAALLLLAACDNPETATERAATAATSADGIDCALAGADAFARHCRLERTAAGALTVHHPDGGFRRVTFAEAGTAAPADGADQGRTQRLPDGRIEWAIDRDRYRLPAGRP